MVVSQLELIEVHHLQVESKSSDESLKIKYETVHIFSSSGFEMPNFEGLYP